MRHKEMRRMMKRDDAEVLREVQKNTEMAMKAIDTISDKVYDDDLALQLSKQSLKYSQIHNLNFTP